MNYENDEEELKTVIIAIIVALAVLIPAGWKIFDWINDIGWIDFFGYCLFASVGIFGYATYNFLRK